MKGQSLWAVLFGGSVCVHVALADTYRTPLAGEEYRTEVFGQQVTAPWQDRRRVTALNLGVLWVPDGPSDPLFLPFGGALVIRDEQAELGGDLVLPFGAVFLWRNLDEGRQRFRGVISGLYNDVRYNVAPDRLQGAELVLTFENFTIPFGRPEFVEGQRVEAVDLEWQYVRGGLGVGYRTVIARGHQDNALEVALTYEPGFIWFGRSSDTARDFIVPRDTYEGRVHLRVRADALERNILELAHRGIAVGSDLVYGHRANWRDWGGSVFGVSDGKAGQDYFSASFYGVAAGGVPFIDSERHRLIASAYAGVGSDLDRFSAFRPATRQTTWEWEALSRPDLPGAAFEEFYSRSYGILDLHYRYEAQFFVYPYVRASWAWIDRPRFQDRGRVGNQMDSLPAVGAGLIAALPWRSQLELKYSYNFGLIRNPQDEAEFGGHSLLFAWSKAF